MKYEYAVYFDIWFNSESISDDPDAEAQDAAMRCKEWLNGYGQAGWELVSVCGPVKMKKSESLCYYLKRPVSSERAS